VILFKYR